MPADGAAIGWRLAGAMPGTLEAAVLPLKEPPRSRGVACVSNGGSKSTRGNDAPWGVLAFMLQPPNGNGVAWPSEGVVTSIRVGKFCILADIGLRVSPLFFSLLPLPLSLPWAVPAAVRAAVWAAQGVPSVGEGADGMSIGAETLLPVLGGEQLFEGKELFGGRSKAASASWEFAA
mmetsp:Transcript_59449/g.164369  ORF Transcript_59449/g.164369 Transcript_59449/m.164369 type:complete len:176 (-) Transcript_59449:759-1286(-)